MEVAEQYPTARVIGVDLSPFQRTHVPENCEFRTGDITADLDQFQDGSTDLIHSRYLHLYTLLVT